jgi:hypothetical protein
MKNIKFTGPLSMTLMAALIDIAGIAASVLYFGLTTGFKGGDPLTLNARLQEALFLLFFPLGLFSPLLWALGGVVFYYVRRSIRNGGLHIAR